MRARMQTFRRLYLSVDPRTLGLLRCVMALVLLVDLGRRWPLIRVFYVNSGLLPNHRMLWHPVSKYSLSFLLSLSSAAEVQVAFVGIACVYISLLIGYRTRLCQILSWICFTALMVRVDVLTTGAECVLAELVLWTAWLPLGTRFSVDAVLRSLREHPEQTVAELTTWQARPREVRLVVSLAVLAAVTQLSVIYGLNALQKNGDTWHHGSAVYYLLHQERIVTMLGLWLREHVPFGVLASLTYGTLVIEGALPFVMLSPWGRPWTRRVAILLIIALHLGIGLTANLGLFPVIMMTFALILIGPEDWDLLAARVLPRAKLRWYVDASHSAALHTARLCARLDPMRIVSFQPWSELPADLRRQLPEASTWALTSLAGQRLLFPSWHRGTSSGYRKRIQRLLVEPLVRAVADRWQAFGHRRVIPTRRNWLTESLIGLLMLLATSNLLVHNYAIPEWLRVSQPRWAARACEYLRLDQGWSLFAPEAPIDDMTVVIDAVTADGRHVDPLNALASRVADPLTRTIPVRLGQSAQYCLYIAHALSDDAYHAPLRDWLLSYHRRTGRAADRIVHFRAYRIEHMSPAPGETAPHDVHASKFLSR
ncbi:MAG: hypothetical protein RL701_2157 [Pseudomonadota bacterium]